MAIVPESRSGKQLAWFLGRLATGGDGASAAELERYVPALRAAAGAVTDEAIRTAWRSRSSRIGAFEIQSIDAASDFAISGTLAAADGKRWRVDCRVEEEAPYRISQISVERVLEFDVSVREASARDAPILSDIERRCPIVLGDSSITFDRGDDYFAFARLMEDATVGLGFVGGVPAAINCGGVHSVCIGGVRYRIMTAVHTRILPEHQRKGLWGAVSRVLNGRYPPATVDGSCGYISVRNAAMQRGFAHTPNKWPVRVLRAQLSCDALAVASVGRPATREDASRIVEVLNACHEAEEMYNPYTTEALIARLERAPSQYSWERMWVSGRAVVGVWPAGESIRVFIESKGQRRESRRGLVLDYGFLPGAEDELERLLRAWCAWLAERRLDTLSVFTSERSPGYELLIDLATDIEPYDVWTPGIPPPEGVDERGLYVDQIYF